MARAATRPIRPQPPQLRSDLCQVGLVHHQMPRVDVGGRRKCCFIRPKKALFICFFARVWVGQVTAVDEEMSPWKGPDRKARGGAHGFGLCGCVGDEGSVCWARLMVWVMKAACVGHG